MLLSGCFLPGVPSQPDVRNVGAQGVLSSHTSHTDFTNRWLIGFASIAVFINLLDPCEALDQHLRHFSGTGILWKCQTAYTVWIDNLWQSLETQRPLSKRKWLNVYDTTGVSEEGRDGGGGRGGERACRRGGREGETVVGGPRRLADCLAWYAHTYTHRLKLVRRYGLGRELKLRLLGSGQGWGEVGQEL